MMYALRNREFELTQSSRRNGRNWLLLADATFKRKTIRTCICITDAVKSRSRVATHNSQLQVNYHTKHESSNVTVFYCNYFERSDMTCANRKKWCIVNHKSGFFHFVSSSNGHRSPLCALNRIGTNSFSKRKMVGYFPIEMKRKWNSIQWRECERKWNRNGNEYQLFDGGTWDNREICEKSFKICDIEIQSNLKWRVFDSGPILIVYYVLELRNHRVSAVHSMELEQQRRWSGTDIWSE